MNHTVEMWSKINVVKNKHKYYAILIQSLCLLQIIVVHGYLCNNFGRKNIAYDLF